MAPHVHALFATVAPHLDPGAEHLRALVRSTTWTADAHDRSGAVQAGLRLCRATFAGLAVLGEDDPACLYLRHILAWETAIQGRPAEAQAIHRDVATRRERVLGRDHPDTLWSHPELAWVAGLQGRWAVAESIYRDVLGRRERVLGRDHPDTLMARHELAWTIATQGRGEEAERTLQVILDARARMLGRDHPRTLASRHELAWAIATQGGGALPSGPSARSSPPGAGSWVTSIPTRSPPGTSSRGRSRCGDAIVRRPRSTPRHWQPGRASWGPTIPTPWSQGWRSKPSAVARSLPPTTSCDRGPGAGGVLLAGGAEAAQKVLHRRHLALIRLAESRRLRSSTVSFLGPVGPVAS